MSGAGESAGDVAEDDWRSLPTGGEALLAMPGGECRGGVVVLGELYGLTDVVSDALARLTQDGYAAAAVDLYWRAEPRLALPYSDGGRRRGFALLRGLDSDEVVADIAAAQRLLAEVAPGTSALVGFSAGGYLGLVAATRLTFDVVAAVYPGWTLNGGAPVAGPPPLADAERLRDALVLFAAGTADNLVAADIEGVELRLTEAQVPHRMLVLDGVPHGFAAPGRPAQFDSDAVERTWQFVLDGLDAGSSRRPGTSPEPPVLNHDSELPPAHRIRSETGNRRRD